MESDILELFEEKLEEEEDGLMNQAAVLKLKEE